MAGQESLGDLGLLKGHAGTNFQGWEWSYLDHLANAELLRAERATPAR